MTRQDIETQRSAIMQAALLHVPFDGWGETALLRGAADAGFDAATARRLFPQGATDLIACHSHDADRRMLAELATLDLDSMKIRMKIATAVRVRLEQNVAHREAVRRALSMLALPQNSALAMRLLYRTVDAMWHAAGDTATDHNFYTKRGLLGGVYSATLLCWLNDNSDGFFGDLDLSGPAYRRGHAYSQGFGRDRKAGRPPSGSVPAIASFCAAGMIDFATQPDRYRHWTLKFDGPVAELILNVDEDGGLKPGYALKLNSYDLGVDIELYDAVQRLRFEHPEVGAVLITSAQDRVFCAGANIAMLGGASHAEKVNFCKFTNETRLGIEDASEYSGQRYIAAIAGTAAGGGYEMALAADHIILVDDGSSAVSLPEVPMLGVLPGTGGVDPSGRQTARAA